MCVAESVADGFFLAYFIITYIHLNISLFPIKKVQTMAEIILKV